MTALNATPAFRVERSTPASRAALIGGAFLFVAMASLPLWGASGTMKLLVEFLTLLALAQMWNLLAGYAGLVSIGQQAFVGLGAYAVLISVDRVGLPPVFALVLVALAALIVASLTSIFAFRLSGGYFAIGTWVIAEVFRIFVANTRELGAGTGVTIQTLVAMPAPERQALTYWLALALGFGSVAAAAIIMRSRLGLALRAVRDSEPAALSLGVNVFRAKRAIYLAASVGAALAGAVIYLQLLRIQPNSAFGVDWTVKMIFIAVIGGLGRIEGPIVGAVVFFALQQALADYGSLYLVLIGGVAVGITLLAPRGLWGLFIARFPVALFGVQRRLAVAWPGGGLPEGRGVAGE
jgi:branched-chain amino acid transport system permease protein